MKKAYKTKISAGNTKTGRIPAVSLPPIITCAPGVECSKKCYALKSYRMYPAVKTAWDSNYEHYKASPEQYFNDIHTWINTRRKPVEYFRFHVSGDIPDIDYLKGMITLARRNRRTKFLVFTKRHDYINSEYNPNWNRPDNLTIIFSAWPGRAMDNPYNFPIAFMQDGTENRVTGGEVECPGNCETCGMCWQLPKIGRNVVFNLH